MQWAAPADTGGSDITGYEVASTPGGFIANTTGATQATVTGLTNGTSYTFTVKATNATGDSAISAPSNAVTPGKVPGPPTAVSATGGNSAAAVQWMAPASNGGSAVISYSVTSTPGGFTASTPGTTQATVTGLTNGTTYTFTVRATNSVGGGQPSAPSNAVTAVGVPAAPSGVSAISGNAAADVQWTAPTDNGGSAISGYEVTSTPGGFTATTIGAVQATVLGLSNGTSYTFTIKAINLTGQSLPSAPSNAVIPATVPAPPTAVSATGGNVKAIVQWTAPADNGGSAITGYSVTSVPAGFTATTLSGTTQATLSGLSNGTSYTFTVKATNDHGDSVASAPSNAVTPATVPGLPTAVSATGGNSQAAVQWTAPANNGGSPVISYTVISTPGSLTAIATGATLATVTGLTNGTSYTFTVKATNSAGEGLPSVLSNAVTPATVPGAPVSVGALSASLQATVYWSAPLTNGGSAITGYAVTSSPGGVTASTVGPTTRLTVTGLSNGVGYTFTVRAINAQGAGPASAPSNLVTPSLACGGTLLFTATAPEPAAGSKPMEVTAGDFNGDGKLDLATANSSSGDVSVLLSNGDGTFQSTVYYNAANSVRGITTGDFNGDGYLDLAVADFALFPGAVSVLLGNGNGTFQTARNSLVGASATGLASGDFNGDGKVDLVVTNQGSNDVSVLLGNGDGTFLAAVNYAVGNLPYAVIAVDFNGDGKLDLAVASNSVNVLLGNGDGTFQSAVNYPVGTNPVSVNSADFNGDGKPDLATANYQSANVTVRLGNGNGTFGPGVNYPTAATPRSVVVGDFNGDGIVDLATGNWSGTVSLLIGTGNGVFQPPTNYPAGTNPVSMVTGDFNRDGKLDFATANVNGDNLSVLIDSGCM